MQEILFLLRDEPISDIHSLHGLKKVPTTTSEHIQIFHDDLKSFIEDPDLYKYSVQIGGTYYIGKI